MGKYGVHSVVVRRRAKGYDVSAEGFGISREKRHFRLRKTADRYSYKLADKYDVLAHYVPYK